MFDTTRQAIKAILATDPSVTKEQADVALKYLSGKLAEQKQETRETLDRVMKRAEVAKLLGCTTVWVTRLGKRGLLRKVGAGKERCMGYAESSVKAFIAGRTK